MMQMIVRNYVYSIFNYAAKQGLHQREAVMERRRLGIVKWFKKEKGYGRIMLDGQDGDHVFVHYSQIRPDPDKFPTGFRFLNSGQKVSFILVEKPWVSDSQRLSATDVEILED